MRLYTERMRSQTSFRRLVQVFVLPALITGITCGVAIWLAPSALAEYSVASIAGITALAVLASIFAYNTAKRRESGLRSTPDTYFDYGFSITKDESWDE